MSHNAFPGFTVCADGSYFCCYRKGTNHNEPPASTPGVLKAKRSTDQGQTWGSEYTIWIPPSDYEVRDNMASTLSDGRVAVTFNRNHWLDPDDYKPSSFVMFSSDNGVTFGTPVQITTPGVVGGLAGLNVAIEGPVVEMDNGDLLTTVYGSPYGGAGHLTAVVVRSQDDGATWSFLAVCADGDADLKNYSETCLLLLASGELVVGVRDDTSSKLCIARSPDDGVSWSAVQVMFNASGRPAMTQATNGAVVIAYRNATNDAAYRTSWNDCWSWEPERLIDDPALSRITYAQMQEVAPNVLGCLYSMEEVDTAGASIRYTTFRAAEAEDPLV